MIEFAEKAMNESPGMHVSPVPVVSESVDARTAVVDDRSDEVRLHDALLLAWKPRHRGMFPDFQGVLTARPSGRGAELSLHGRYKPPFGFSGAVFDAVAGQQIARITMKRVLADLCARIERKWDAERASRRGGVSS
ncbi:MAG TPA: hypothetical protein VFO29_02905 [Candidatus Rubrimentiphilum sp.]|nr:hypothetical protein [Candidatus Rubrimentiphilum sp.]